LTRHFAAGLDTLPVARLHRLAGDTSRPAPGPDLPASTEPTARLLKAAPEAARETCDPRRPQESEAAIPAQGADAPPVRTDG
jgi:hypothetical protein